jgi:hypothetical protein
MEMLRAPMWLDGRWLYLLISRRDTQLARFTEGRLYTTTFRSHGVTHRVPS